MATGATIIVRYADDFVVGFQRKQDAERFLHDLKERLGQFELELHPDKTRLIEFGRFAMVDRRAPGERRPETFDFLGFTHYCRKKRNGKFGLGRKPIAKRVTRTLNRIKGELRKRMHEDVHETARWSGSGGPWMAELFRRPDQQLGRKGVCAAALMDLGECPAKTVTEGPDHDRRCRAHCRIVLATRPGSAPLADGAFRRQTPEVGAPCEERDQDRYGRIVAVCCLAGSLKVAAAPGSVETETNCRSPEGD